MKYCLTYLLLCSLALAQNSYFEANVPSQEYTTDDFITLKISSDYEGNYQDPNFTGLKILSEYKSESIQQNTVVVNGRNQIKMVRQFTKTYVLKPTKEGEVRIGSATIQKGTDIFTSKPVVLDIKPGTMPLLSSLEVDPDAPLTLRVYPDMDRVFVGQPFKVVVKAYSKDQMIRVRNLQKPAGYIQHATSILPSLNAELEIEYVNGERMYSVVLSEDVLVYNQGGTYSWDPFDIRMVLRQQPYGISYENAFSNTVEIEVVDLPAAPANFSGIGGFNLSDSVWVDNKMVGDAEDGFEISIKIEGAGNIHRLQAPVLNIPKYLDVYAPETKEEVSATPIGSEGYKIFKYYVLPEANGNFRFQPLNLSYFDFDKGAYIDFKGKDLEIAVNKTGLPQLEDLLKKEEKAKISKAGTPQTALNSFRKSDELFSKTMFQAVGWGFLSLGLIFFLFPSKNTRKKEKKEETFNPQIAAQIAHNFLKEAEAHIQKNDQLFYEKLNKGIYNYFQQKWEWELSATNKAAILKRLWEEDCSSEEIERVKNVLDQAQMGMYAPIQISKTDLLVKAKSTLESLEKQLKK